MFQSHMEIQICKITIENALKWMIKNFNENKLRWNWIANFYYLTVMKTILWQFDKTIVRKWYLNNVK
jgi:hypothetical protein